MEKDKYYQLIEFALKKINELEDALSQNAVMLQSLTEIAAYPDYDLKSKLPVWQDILHAFEYTGDEYLDRDFKTTALFEINNLCVFFVHWSRFNECVNDDMESFLTSSFFSSKYDSIIPGIYVLLSLMKNPPQSLSLILARILDLCSLQQKMYFLNILERYKSEGHVIEDEFLPTSSDMSVYDFLNQKWDRINKNAIRREVKKHASIKEKLNVISTLQSIIKNRIPDFILSNTALEEAENYFIKLNYDIISGRLESNTSYAVMANVMATFTYEGEVFTSEEQIKKGAAVININSPAQLAILYAICRELKAIRSGTYTDFLAILCRLELMQKMDHITIRSKVKQMDKKYDHFKDTKGKDGKVLPHTEWKNQNDVTIANEIHSAMTSK